MWRYYEKKNNIIFSLGDNTARYDTFFYLQKYHHHRWIIRYLAHILKKRFVKNMN